MAPLRVERRLAGIGTAYAMAGCYEEARASLQRFLSRYSKRIKYFGDLLKLTSIFLLAVGGGTISLLLGNLTPTKTVLAVLGAGLTSL